MAHKMTYADFEREIEDTIRAAQAQEGVFANFLGDRARALARALADNPDAERLGFIVRHITDEYDGGEGAEQAICLAVDALRARGDARTLDRFAAILIARRTPAYLSLINLTGQLGTEAKEAATAFVQWVRDAEVAFATIFRDPHDRLPALLAGVETEPALVARKVLAANLLPDINPLRLSAVAEEIAASADHSAGFDRVEAMKRDFARSIETGGYQQSFEAEYDKAYLSALAHAWRQGTAEGRQLITALFARIFTEGRQTNEKLIALRRVLVAEAELTRDDEVLRSLCVASLSLPARRLVEALHRRDQEAMERLAFLRLLYDARLTAAGSDTARRNMLEAQIRALEAGESAPVPPILDRGKIDGHRFWNLVAAAGAETTSAALRVAWLTERLASFSPDGIKGFERELGRRLRESYSWDLWALADALLEGCGDDAFEYFRCWLVLQGEEVFTRVLNDPDAAWRWLRVGELPQCEDFLDVASKAMIRRGIDPSELPQHPDRGHPRGERFDAKEQTQRFPRDLRGAGAAG